MPNLEPGLFPDVAPEDLPLAQSDPVAECCNCGAVHHAGDSNRNRCDETEVYCPDCAQCEECDAIVSRDDTYDVDGAQYCCECTVHCANCGGAFRERGNDLLLDHDGNTYCCDCATCCAACGYAVISDNSISYGEQELCQRCYDRNYFTCEGCDQVIHNDNYGCDGYCESCAPEQTDEEDRDDDEMEIRPIAYPRRSICNMPMYDPVIERYDYRPSSRFLPGRGFDYYLGIEIEVDRYDQLSACAKNAIASNLPEEWYAKSDGSLNHGFECVSHPGTWAYWRDNDFKWCKKLVALGMRSYDTTTCGMHVHVSRDWLSLSHQLKLRLFFQKNEATIIRLSRRAGTDWLHYAKIDPNTPLREHVRKVKMVATTDRDNIERDERYEAINMINEKTIEFRIFRGTLNVQSIKRNLAFVVAVCHYAKESKRTQLSFSEFANWLYVRGNDVLGCPTMADGLRQWVVNCMGGNLPGDDGE